MRQLKKYSVDPYIFISFDLDKKEVVEAGFGYPNLFCNTAKRTDDSFEEILDKALASLKITDAIYLKELTGNDEKLKESFKRVYQRKLKEADVYKIEVDI